MKDRRGEGRGEDHGEAEAAGQGAGQHRRASVDPTLTSVEAAGDSPLKTPTPCVSTRDQPTTSDCTGTGTRVVLFEKAMICVVLGQTLKDKRDRQSTIEGPTRQTRTG